ncbi:MAG: BofC C-terminal domain-containing protein [Tissierellaceae bacterium]
MKEKKIFLIFLVSLTLFISSFFLGYNLIARFINQGEIEQIDSGGDDRGDNLDFEITKEEVQISPNTIMEERIHHTPCGHVVTKTKEIEERFINMTRDDFLLYLENFPDKKLISFSQSKITIGITKNHLCENHYVIGEKDGNIAIYRIDENGERKLETFFPDYPISLLMEIDQNKLIEGIVIDSQEELSDVLENFIS